MPPQTHTQSCSKIQKKKETDLDVSWLSIDKQKVSNHNPNADSYPEPKNPQNRAYDTHNPISSKTANSPQQLINQAAAQINRGIKLNKKGVEERHTAEWPPAPTANDKIETGS